jgi:L-alanine-DL-glutamate epimerase-like enolase superfamily enzyme
MRRVHAQIETWPIAGTFTIARGSRTEARVVVATIRDNGATGRGECVPYARYGETVEGVGAAMEEASSLIEAGASRADLLAKMQPGAARNALDCALWDLEAKSASQRAWTLAGVPEPQSVTTAYTLSLGTPESMENAARAASHRPLLKAKLGGDGDWDRIAAVRSGAPRATLIADANEAWDEGSLVRTLEACREAGVRLIEQPFPAGKDAILSELSASDRFGIPFCADESLHTAADLPEIAARYQAINIKLDKTGGLTEALHLLQKARGAGLKIMIGCMVGTSLAMAPALLLASGADYVDLDGPLLLARDRTPGLAYEGSMIAPFGPELWG